MRVIDRVHRHTARLRPDAHPAGAAGLAHRQVAVVAVADLVSIAELLASDLIDLEGLFDTGLLDLGDLGIGELGIADLLKDGPVGIDDLAAKTGTHSDALYRVMRMLASQGIFRELKGRRFKSTSLARPLEEDQIRYLILVHLNRNQFAMFGELMKSVRTGDTVSGNRSGSALFDHIGDEEKRNEWFNRAMSSASKMQVPALLSAFPYKKYPKIIDVGGGEGLFLAAVLGQAAQSRGVVFDLPNVLETSGDVIVDHFLEGRMEIQAGDFFESVPAGGDLYMLKSVLHDWDDASAVKILQNVHRVM